MRDLLYLSETKMRALVPQVPGRLRRRLGFETGVNVGVATAKATLPSESQQPSSISLLDATVKMIEKTKGVRRRTETDLRAGDWIQFEDEFRFGDAATSAYVSEEPDSGHALAGLVYFATTHAEPPFVLVGSSVHVLDRWQSGETPEQRVGWFYLEAVIAYARQLAELSDEAATTEFVPPPGIADGLAYGLWVLCRTAQFGNNRRDRWATEPVRLCGHARILAVIPTPAGPPSVLATPLYVEYAQRN
ncbi:SAVMC3_10250 family protein [Streptomyces sp. NPDC053499]|uniref:SAVMC3_10250 family protein n=1 Tax=Streptomyces sp. NPDC053499 TaxID=3365707 RepID=UPI0037CD1536